MFTSSNPANILRRRVKMIVLVGVVFALLSSGVSLFFPMQYRADAEVLIISKSRYGVDPYTVVKSAERVGENLVAIMRTSDFYNKVVSNQNFSFDKSRFEGEGVTERIKRKRWQKDVVGSVLYGTGVVRVSAYHTDPAQAVSMAAATVDTLASKAWEYVGGDVAIKVVNSPVATAIPVRPNLAANAIVGFIFGILFASVLVVRRSGN